MNEITDDELLTKLRNIDPYKFEEFIAALWELQEWETEVTHGSGDKGIDVIANRSFPYQTEAHIQAKRYDKGNRVSGPEMQKYTSLTQRQDVDLAIVITTSSFTQQAVSLAKEFNIKLINGQTLAGLIQELEAIDLLTEYHDSTETESLSESRQKTIETGTQTENSSSTKTVARQPSVTVAEGDWLRIELVGADHVAGNIGNPSVPTEIDGLVLAFEIVNTSDQSWEFRGLNKDNDQGLSIYDEDGYHYVPTWLPDPFLRKKAVGGGWTWDYTTVRAASRSRLAVYFDVPSDTQISSIEYEEEVWRGIDNHEHFDRPASTESLQLQLPQTARNIVGGLPAEILACIN